MKRPIAGSIFIFTSLISCSKIERDSDSERPSTEDEFSIEGEQVDSYIANFEELFHSKFDPALEVKSERLTELLISVGEKHYAKSDDDCADTEDPLSPHAEMRSGKLTEGRANQQLIALRFARCGQPYWFREGYLKLYSKNLEIASGKVDCLERFFLIPHPKLDARHAVLGVCGGMGQGFSESHAAIFDVKGKEIYQLEDLGRVAGDNCGVYEKGGVRIFSVISFEKNRRRSVRTYKGSCEDWHAAEFQHSGLPVDADYDLLLSANHASEVDAEIDSPAR
ncbi:hypothetical protein HPT27_12485 [Permianibacter sp. IMCC34836]|uniref:hypothetical protein n=1 Tax=Permianibacter fluminis TaxID=2738515 RepID=UPI0015565381|nr:hypothetical protein [Permianibacter fluminis]NQD37845.1 hypothetical protein [Permianibacter fluminis]